jgi:hypothetical protein
LSGSSWGIEREQIFFSEYLELPAFFQENQNLYDVVDLFDKLVSESKRDFPNIHYVEQKEKEINQKLESIIGLTNKQQILIQDTLKFSLDLFEKGENSIGFNRTLPNENEAYANMLCDELNDFFQDSPFKVNATVYDVRLRDPLNVVVLSFKNEPEPIIIQDAKDLTPLLKQLNTYSVQEKGQNIYVRKQFRYYNRDTIYLIKPNQKRFWTRSQAINDAMSLIVEIANMGGNNNG